jgi:hypothetical protein
MNPDSSTPVAAGNEPPPPPAPRRGGAPWVSVMLFVLGVLAGALAFALFAILSQDPLLVRQLGPQAVDVAQIRQAAREGTLDAIATLQAGGGAQPATPVPAATPTSLPKNAIALREANRLGKPNAPVIIVEYSDFQ